MLTSSSDLFTFAVCEQAYSMAQNLDPKSDGRGVLQFKTGLASVIKVQFARAKIFLEYFLWHNSSILVSLWFACQAMTVI